MESVRTHEEYKDAEGIGGAMSREQAHDRLRIECERDRSLGFQYWPIFLGETGESVGCAGLRPWSMDPQTIEVGVNLMRSDHANSRKLLQRVGFSYTHNILWGPKEIEVCMWAITAESWNAVHRSS
jgi:RimJ/RimL family protein N-acetyltransferase